MPAAKPKPETVKLEFSLLDRAIQKEVTPSHLSTMLLNAARRTHGENTHATAVAIEAHHDLVDGKKVEIGVFGFRLLRAA